MHEMGIALQIMDIVTASIPEDQKSARIRNIHLRVGKLSSVIPDNLRFCFDAAIRNSELDGANLVIQEIPLEAVCNNCGHRWIIEGPAFSCETCQSGDIHLLSGQELDIVSIEIEEVDIP